jgi:galactokinase
MMMRLNEIDLQALAAGPEYLERCETIIRRFDELYGARQGCVLISAPGRAEIGGNHTDHQKGCVVAAAINLDALGLAAPNGTRTIRLTSEGYVTFEVSLDDLSAPETGYGKTESLIRGVAAGFAARGYPVEGFDAYLSSQVLIGSGLSSSAAFEVWVGCAISHLFCGGEVPALELALIGGYAENTHFGKPSGLEDQTASAHGGVVFIDFADTAQPRVEKLRAEIAGHALCVIDSGADHAGLTAEYAAIRTEMNAAAAFFGKDVLSRVVYADFLAGLPKLRRQVGDRAALRAWHFFDDNARAKEQAEALRGGDTQAFLRLVAASGRSSFMYLQNVLIPGETDRQDLAVCLKLCEELLAGRGAFRIQGGGFAGTVEAFVPEEAVDRFRAGIENVFGPGSCHILNVRSAGAVRVL